LVDLAKLEDISNRLGDAVLEPGRWPALMEEICAAVGATGAAMLQSDIRTEDIPRTPSISEFFDKIYFQNKLHVSDVRAARGVPLLLSGTSVVTDADLFKSETEMLRDLLYVHLAEWGLRWFAGIGFKAGSALWGLTIQRTPRQGMFEPDEVAALSHLADRLTQAATLSTAVGRTAIVGVTNALDLIDRPALALDRLGGLIAINKKAASYLGREFVVRSGRVALIDKEAQAGVVQLIDQLRTSSDLRPPLLPPVIVRRAAGRPLVLHPLPVPAAARSPFLGARVVLVVKDMESDVVVEENLLIRLFGLTPAQAKLAVRIASGSSVEEAAAELGVGSETMRKHLKAVFAKTDTHRQGELVALLSKLSGI
jgi:DNA-binding CsgD family transcriptional regulator